MHIVKSVRKRKPCGSQPIIKWHAWLSPKEGIGYVVSGETVEVSIETKEVKSSGNK